MGEETHGKTSTLCGYVPINLLQSVVSCCGLDNLMNEKEPEVLQGPLQEDIEKDQNPALSAFEVHRSGLLGEAGHFTGA